MPTARDLIKVAMREAGGLLASGASLTTDEETDYLALLNSIIDQCNADRLYIYQIQEYTGAWAGGTASRTIGSSGNYNTTRPVKIEDAQWTTAADEVFDLEVLNWREHDKNIVRLTETSSDPIRLFYDSAYPLGTIYLTPIPSMSGTIRLRVWTPLTAVALIGDAVSLPPGYQTFLEMKLATRIARNNGRQIDQSLMTDLREAEKLIKRNNIRVPVMRLPVEIAGGVGYDINKG